MSKAEQERDREILELVHVVDNEGTHLTRSEIDFIAGLIDGKVQQFTTAQAARVRRIHLKRVINGTPEDDL